MSDPIPPPAPRRRSLHRPATLPPEAASTLPPPGPQGPPARTSSGDVSSHGTRSGRKRLGFTGSRGISGGPVARADDPPRRRRRPPPVRLVAPDRPSPARPGEDVAFARVAGRALVGAGLRPGDHVFLWRTRVAPDGALASVVDRSGRGAVWRVRHDRDALALYDGGATRVGRTGPWPEVTGVVVGILRKFDLDDAGDRASRSRSVDRTPRPGET
ncbi:MAG: hypothetical protein JNM10_11855 [Planctomycetia bacterium]|nr:hypothetical protein [Planctomycetia bacterium]